ncbi:MAG: glycosyltransferase family 39 protein [Planctomycetes bacterium]|nr:glycosyltransferase family 39 protein [Planctomycetota bacterium]
MRAGAAERLAAAALLVLLAALLFLGARHKSATYDEWSYLAAGIRWLQTGSGDVHEDVPAAIKAWIALPANLLLRPELPATEDRYAWTYGERFRDGLADPAAALRLARLPVMVLALLLAVYVYVLARALWGGRAGLLALVVLVLEPGVLGHGRVASGDVALAAMGAGALLFLWRYLGTGRWPWLALAALHLALAAETKYVGAVLLPLAVAAVLAERVVRERAAAGLRLAARPAASLAVATLLVYAALVMCLHGGPQEALSGYRSVLEHVDRGHRTYLLGRSSTTGWWYYHPLVLLVKMPVPLLIGLLALPLAGIGRRGASRLAFLAIPALGWLLLAMASTVCLGYRHVLLVPVCAAVAFGAHASAAPAGGRRRWQRPIIAVLVVWLAVGTFAAYPGYIAYFNDAARALAEPHRILIDSNLDWGQDLPALAAWLRAHGDPPLTLLYFGRDDPARFGIRAHMIPPYADPASIPTELLAVSASYYARAAARPEFVRLLARSERIATAGNTLFLFRLPPPRRSENASSRGVRSIG